MAAEAREPTAGAAPSDPWLGRVVAGRYRVVDFLAAGGMGRIYRAEQEPLGRMVALKVLNPRYTASGDDPEFRKRFLLEAATYAKLHHPNVVTIFDYGLVEGEDTYYMAMEFVVGRTLSQVVRAEGRMPPSRVVRIARQIGRALREAHRLGIVHRDLKPSNVMLVHTDEGESVKVLDFGLVKVLRDDSEDLTMEGKFLGSPKYMSPEQIRHHNVDARSDLYSLGVIMFELLTGKVPFEGTQAVQTLMMHVSQPVPSMRERGANVSLELEGVVQRCLMKEPEQRFVDVDEFMTALRMASAATGEDSSFDPARSEAWTLSASGDRLASSTGSFPSVSGPQALSSSQPGSYPGSQPGSYPGSQPGSYPGSQPGSYPGSGSQPGSYPGSGSGSGAVTAPVATEIPSPGAQAAREAREGSRSKGPLIVGAAIVLAAAVLGILLSRKDEPPTPSPVATTQPPAIPASPVGAGAGTGTAQTATVGTAVEPTAPANPVPTPAHGATDPSTQAAADAAAAAAPAVVLRLRSVPEADVFENDRRLGSTPLEIPLDPAATAARIFAIRRAGFRSDDLTVEPTSTSIDREIRLRRAPVAGSSRPSRPPTSAGPATAPPERPRPNPDLDIRTAR